MQKIEFIYSFGSQEPINIWTALEPILRGHEDIDSFLLYGKKVKASKFPAEFKKLKGKAFNIESEQFSFHLATVTNYQHIALQIEAKTVHEEEWWSEWVNELVILDGFVQAWLVDSEFDYWQNATDPIEYESKGKSYDGLPMKSNGLPPPLEQLEIDTSHNLGLRKLCDGYVEAIGAHMWLSESFLNLVGKDIENIKNSTEVSVVNVAPKIFHVGCSVELFKDSSTQREQKGLRMALYC
ncbi:hypothetical protein [Shewanella algae]|uniref:hypothetical protein n=1 Tax=Shewanella algae TaxID=38313 RepID=UPI00313ABE8F